MQQSGRGNGWVGWLIFIVLVFGGRFLPPVANWLAQVTGLPITAPALVAGLIGLAVLSSVVGSLARQVGRSRGASETRLPTPMTPVPPPDAAARPSRAPRPVSPPASMRLPPGPTSADMPPPRLPRGEQRLPGPPKFEPIIDPRVLTFGIVGLLALGAFFLVLLALSGAMP